MASCMQAWVDFLRPLLRPIGDFAALRALLPPSQVMRAVAMVTTLRILAHVPLSPACKIIASARMSLKALCDEAGMPDVTADAGSSAASVTLSYATSSSTLGLAFPLRLAARCAQQLQVGKSAPNLSQWSAVVEDLIRWGAPPALGKKS